MNKLLSLAVLAALLAMAAADCQVSVTQTLGSAWTTNGQDFSQWSVTLTNTGSDGVKSVDLSISNDSLFDQLWNIVKDSRGLYLLPDSILKNGGPTHRREWVVRIQLHHQEQDAGHHRSRPSTARPSRPWSPP